MQRAKTNTRLLSVDKVTRVQNKGSFVEFKNSQMYETFNSKCFKLNLVMKTFTFIDVINTKKNLHDQLHSQKLFTRKTKEFF